MLDPEKALWTAVLERAVYDLVGAKLWPIAATPYDRPRLRYFTRLWFESDNEEPGSFRWICDELDLDASWLRRRLFAIADRSGKLNVQTARVCIEREAAPPLLQEGEYPDRASVALHSFTSTEISGPMAQH